MIIFICLFVFSCSDLFISDQKYSLIFKKTNPFPIIFLALFSLKIILHYQSTNYTSFLLTNYVVKHIFYQKIFFKKICNTLGNGLPSMRTGSHQGCEHLRSPATG